MSYSYTATETKAFTITHANYLASKLATDLKRIQRFYNSPSDIVIEKYEKEIAQYLKNGYLNKVTYGFQKNGNWIEPTLIYTASDIESSTNDDPGKVKPGKDVNGASFYSFLEYSDKWHSLSEAEKDKFNEALPIKRATAITPGISGYLEDDRMYSSGGKALSRASVRSFE